MTKTSGIKNTLEDRARELNTLLGMDLVLLFNPNPLYVEHETGNCWDGTIPWTLYNGDEVLLDRGNYREVDGYLSALEWTGKNAIITFVEPEEKLKIRVEVTASFYDGDNQPVAGGYRTHIINLSNVEVLERLIEYFCDGALNAKEVNLSQGDCIPYDIEVDDFL